MKKIDESDTRIKSELSSFQWLSVGISHPTTSTTIYHSFKWKDQTIDCFDAVRIQKQSTIEVGRIMKIYHKTNNQMPFVLVKWYCRSRDDTKKLIFDHNKEEDIMVTRIISKATILDTESDLDQYRSRYSTNNHNVGTNGTGHIFHSFYCDALWRLDDNNNRILVPISNFNEQYWREQQQNHSQIFATKSNRRSSATSHHTTATTSSHEEKQDLSQQQPIDNRDAASHSVTIMLQTPSKST